MQSNRITDKLNKTQPKYSDSLNIDFRLHIEIPLKLAVRVLVFCIWMDLSEAKINFLPWLELQLYLLTNSFKITYISPNSNQIIDYFITRTSIGKKLSSIYSYKLVPLKNILQFPIGWKLDLI